MEREEEDLERPTSINWLKILDTGQKIWPLSRVTGRNGENLSSKAELAQPDDYYYVMGAV